MQLQITKHVLMALGGMQVATSHAARLSAPSPATNTGMDDHTAPALLSPAKSVLQTRDWVPHDVPDHPHCTYKGKDSRMYMVFSKDFGRHDETSQDGCGNHMLLHLREGKFGP